MGFLSQSAVKHRFSDFSCASSQLQVFSAGSDWFGCDYLKCFYLRNRKTCTVFLSSYRNTSGSLGE